MLLFPFYHSPAHKIEETSFFGGRGDPLKKRILTHGCAPLLSFHKEPCRRVKGACLHIVGGLSEAHRSAIIRRHESLMVA